MKYYYSDLSLKLNFEIINKVKLAREASQENFAFLTTKYQQMAKAEHLICPKVGGGAQTHFCPPLLKVRGHKPLLLHSPTPLLNIHLYFDLVFMFSKVGVCWMICQGFGCSAQTWSSC